MTKDKKHEKKQESQEIFSSSSLHQQLNRERKLEGKDELAAINPMGGTNRNYSDKDKSFSNSLDFFVKLAKKEKEEKNK